VRQLVTAGGILAAIVVLGAAGYHVLGGGAWPWGDCFYMTFITLSTVGFAETLHGMEHTPFARAWTVGLILLGSGTLVYFVSTLTAFIVEGDLGGAIRRNRMQKRIDALTKHIIVCGAGTTGEHVVSELIATATPFVVVDVSESRLSHMQQVHGEERVLFVIGDATDDDVLKRAGIERCRGVLAAITDDKSNLFVTITARALNSGARIVAKAVEHSADPKLRRAGADGVVSTNFIGGMRLVSEMIRPRVTQFLDDMLRDKEQNLRIEEATIPEGSPLVGLALRDTAIRKVADVLILAIRDTSGETRHNPRPDTQLAAGMTLIVLGSTRDVRVLRDGIADASIGKA